LPILPNELKKSFREYGLNDVTISVLLQNKDICYFYVELIKTQVNKISSAIMIKNLLLLF
jgi:Asp-tRNA(Asn)/Glu-tRNA(Gln) amidotransferase B subunit